MLAAVLALATLLSAAAPAPPAALGGDARPAAPRAAELVDSTAAVPRAQALELSIDPAGDHWVGSLRAQLDVRRPTRYLLLRRHGTELHRVELGTPAGAMPVTFGVLPGDSLLIEARAPLPPGRAGLAILFGGTYARATGAARGLVRQGRAIELRQAFGGALPAWCGAPATPWELLVHVPAGCRVRASLPLRGVSRQGAWRTWSFGTPRALPADSLRVRVLAGGGPR